MFDTSFSFTKVNTTPKGEEEVFQQIHTYRFRAERETYICQAVEYDNRFMTIEYYPKAFKDSPNRFNKLTNHGKPLPIFRTVLNIMLSLHHEFPDVSFGFIGVESEMEEKQNTKRYRIYKYITENFFSAENFIHYTYPEYSIYILLNRNIENRSDVLSQIEQLFIDYLEIDKED